MSSDDELRALWDRARSFKFVSLPEEQSEPQGFCRYAKEFADWVEAELLANKEGMTERAINEAKLDLFDKYWEINFRMRKHHVPIYSAADHLCVYHVFERTSEELIDLHRYSVKRPPLYEERVITKTVETIVEREVPITELKIGEERYKRNRR